MSSSPLRRTRSDEWVEATDPQSGATYYWNAKLQRSSWTKPARAPAAVRRANAAAGPLPTIVNRPATTNTAAAVEPRKKLAARRVKSAIEFDIDDLAAESSRDLAGGTGEEVVDAVKTPTVKKSSSIATRHIDTRTGHPYWYDPKTGVTTWHNPNPDAELPVETRHYRSDAGSVAGDSDLLDLRSLGVIDWIIASMRLK